MRAAGLERFVEAQAALYGDALAELRAGAKRSHWMWFVFPQLVGLGRSAAATFYGIASLDEARAYLAHPVLGPRYRECVDTLARLPLQATARRVFGSVDERKLRSSLTLFAAAAPDDARYRDAIARWFGGVVDPLTTQRLGAG